jgi:hypothetical protein
MKKILIFVVFTLSGIQLTLGQIIVANSYVVNTNTYDTIQGEYVSGLVTYNPDTRTLTLENATIVERPPQSFESSSGVLSFSGTSNNRLDTINIKFLGNNTLSTYSLLEWCITGYYCTQINILGPGSVTLNGYPGIALQYAQELTVREGATLIFPQLNVPGYEYVGIGSQYERAAVLIDSSTFRCESGTPFLNIASLQLSRCHIEFPQDTYFSEPTGTLLNADGTPVSGYFVIVPDNGTAVPQYLEESGFSLYPNPARDYVHVECTMSNIQWDGATVEVFDIYGKLLLTERMSSGTATLNVSGLAAGVYVLRVTDAEGREHQGKIVKR